MYPTLFVIDFRWLVLVWAIASVALIARSWLLFGWSKQTRDQLVVLGVLGVVVGWVLPRMVGSEGLPIRGYGVMLFGAVAAGVGLSMWRARRRGIDPDLVLSLGVWFLFFGIAGARLFYIIEYWDKFQKRTLAETLFAMLNLTEGGLVVYGSLLAGGLALVFFVHRYRLPGLAFTDLIAPGVVLGVGLGRLGCFLNGCCYGGLTDIPWAVQFPQNSPAYVDQMQRGQIFIHGLRFQPSLDSPPVIDSVEPNSQAAAAGLKPGERIVAINGQKAPTVEVAQLDLLKIYGAGAPLRLTVADRPADVQWNLNAQPEYSRPVHPTQLYSLIDALLLCFLLLAYEPYKRVDGELTAIVLTIHPISRFLLEIIRVDEASVFNTGMSISQNISIAVFLGGLALWAYLFMRRPGGAAWPREAMLAAAR
ncbi:MAG TPA: prolipoprotein diacylglyceryl transferase family protein [Pirellulales bacterium]|jgi:phosphatidylglycerol:prolipoprotein diacylglycerol transferase